jgi:flagellar motor switch protein FliN/FliY
MADEEKTATATEGGAEASSGGGFEDISWEDAAADLEKQKEMLRADAEKPKEETQPARYEAPAAVSVAEKEPRNIDLILDIPLQVSVELGRTKMLINDLLQLGQGSVIELSKLVGEPLEIFVNEKLVAKGEVVVVNEKFGVRLTDIVSPVERIESLK